jgi:trehalose utilization protein
MISSSYKSLVLIKDILLTISAIMGGPCGWTKRVPYPKFWTWILKPTHPIKKRVACEIFHIGEMEILKFCRAIVKFFTMVFPIVKVFT